MQNNKEMLAYTRGVIDLGLGLGLSRGAQNHALRVERKHLKSKN